MYIGYNKLRYVPDFSVCDIVLVGSFSLDTRTPINVESILGGAEAVYCSKESLYLCSNIMRKIVLPDIDYKNSIRFRYYYSTKTAILKFELFNSKAAITSCAAVNGRVLNQFSMDEFNGYFRIVTTGERLSPIKREFKSYTSLYIFDKNMKLVGMLDDIAKDERMYSARFIQDRLYLVTFKYIDPFFVIDISNPKRPKILGYLKIPGYSTYLHPYDEKNIIGFGKDTEDINQRFAVDKGLKIALFNVEDVENPIELFKIVIGDRGTDSELLHNHKALLFDKEKNILAFPVEVYEKGALTFVGAYVYRIDMQNGFLLRGKILHKTYDGKCEKIKRLIYIDNVLYSVSDNIIKAYLTDNLNELRVIYLNYR